MVVDPFRSRTARVADEHLRPLPGTDSALALGMMRAIVDAGLHDEQWCRAHTDGYDELLEALGDWSPDRAAGTCGVPAADIGNPPDAPGSLRRAESTHRKTTSMRSRPWRHAPSSRT